MNKEESKEWIKSLRIADGCETNFWYEIKTQKDVTFLIEHYFGFHDSTIVRAEYIDESEQSDGSFVIDSKAILLSLFFKTPWIKYELELRFIGLRRINLIGFVENYSSEMSGCYLDFYKEKIIFANDASFDPAKPLQTKLLDKEPMITFVVADELNWRFLNKNLSR